MESLVIAIAMTGVVHLIIGIAVGRCMRTRDDIPAESRVMLREFNSDLAKQLRSLCKVRDTIPAGSSADRKRWTDSLRSQVEQIIQIVQQGQEVVTQISSAAKLKPSHPSSDGPLIDAANLENEVWFPKAAGRTVKATDEQRKARRFPFDRVQSIAPTINDTIPEDSAFYEVRFRDISTGGFAFLVREPLEAERIVAKLGMPPYEVLVLAEIAHQRETWYDGAWMCHVGCKILRRMSETSSEQRELAVSHVSILR